ncbi:MAG: NAD(P)H-hydrate epimerase, partial [Spirochaetota bacterium]
MKTLVSSSEAAALDIRTKNDLCLRELQLMEKATIRLWDSIRAALPNKGSKDMKILAVAGKGNNGGDALAVLRHAWSAGFENVSAIVSSEHLSPSCSAQAESLASIGARMHPWSDVGLEMARRMMGQADVVLDGILGTGIDGPARGEAGEMIQAFPGQDAMGSEELVSGKREG